ncbi:MAG: hypothetical protein HOP15_10475 [Planctomycetes bacterium]|nr:hypothetical protein [Planctomycetota bacterium]
MPFEFSPERPFDKAVIVVGLQVTYQGEVREVSGAPIVGCFVTLAMDEATQRRILGERERSRGARWEAVTREDGRFRFADVAWSQGLRLEIDDPAYLRKRVEVPPISQDDMLVVLEPRADSRTLYGVVLEPDGALVPRALVVADDGRVVRSDAAGVFALDGAPGRPRTLTAFQRGFLPGRTVTDSSGGTWEEPFRVVLGGRPLSIQGRVEDAAGHPVEGALVWIANYTNLLVRGLPLDGDLTYSGSTSEEALIQEAHACRPVRSNSAGCFELQGLTDRDYQVCAVHPTTLLHAIAAGSPGDPLVLGLPSGELRTIEGRIVSLHGQPIPDVIVFLRRHLGRGPGLDSPSGGRCTASDELGRFSFKDVCEDGAYLEFAGDQIPEVERFEVPPTLSFEVTLPAMRKFRVELDDPERADSFCVIDGSQKPLEMRSRIGNETLVSPLMDLARGTSEILLVSERASAIRLYREGSLVTTASLFLAGEGLNLVTIPR